MAKVWDYKGYTIDEGLKPRDENFKPDYYQYFFIVKKAGERVMKVCVWAPRADAETMASAREYVEKGGRVDEFIREIGLSRVKELIDSSVFENILIEMTAAGVRELPLDKQDGKIN